MQRILLVKTSSLGDVVHNFPVVTDIRKRYSNARIDWAVEEAYQTLVSLHPGVDHVIPVATRRWRWSPLRRHTWHEVGALRHQLRGVPYDIIIDTQGLARSAIVARLATGHLVGFSKTSVREAVAARFYDTTFHVPRDRHAVERNRQLAAFALDYPIVGVPDYGLLPAFVRRSDNDRRGYAVCLHGTARASKQWPETHWRALVQWLSGMGLGVQAPWGTEDEFGRSRRITNEIADASVPPKLGMREVAQLLSGARIVVGVDTGLLHLAAALKVPLVAIFSVTDPTLTGPVGAGRIAVCHGKGRAPVLEAVQTAVRGLLNEGPSDAVPSERPLDLVQFPAGR